jgi:hypothetical protein
MEQEPEPEPLLFKSRNRNHNFFKSSNRNRNRKKMVTVPQRCLQAIIMYEYLPSFLGTHLAPYAGYKPDIHPGISHVFQSAAFR